MLKPTNPYRLPPFKYDCEEAMKPFMVKILEGEYDIHYVPSKNIVENVLDLGGNIGAFTFWAAHRWPAAKIHAYEPDPINCAAFRKHVSESGLPAWRYNLIQAAVTANEAPTIQIYRSKINCGMNSVRPGLAGAGCEPFNAPTFHPRDLPQCDMLKVDTEGCEVEIIENYLATHDAPALISYEYHSEPDKKLLEQILDEHYIVCTGEILYPNLGTLNLVHRDCVQFKTGE